MIKKRGRFVKIKKKKMIIGCDHTAFTMKEVLKLFLKKKCISIKDIGTYGRISVDYSDVGSIVASEISNGFFDLGILICGTGIGMSMVANRFSHIRAALCNDILTAKMSKKHNNSNILVMGARIITEDMAVRITQIWLETNFEKGRHLRRLGKFDNVDKIMKN